MIKEEVIGLNGKKITLLTPESKADQEELKRMEARGKLVASQTLGEQAAQAEGEDGEDLAKSGVV